MTLLATKGRVGEVHCHQQVQLCIIFSDGAISSKINIVKVLDKFNPDIVHLHNYNFQITPSILPEIKKRNIKIIQTVHDSQMVCPCHRLYNSSVLINKEGIQDTYHKKKLVPMGEYVPFSKEVIQSSQNLPSAS